MYWAVTCAVLEKVVVRLAWQVAKAVNEPAVPEQLTGLPAIAVPEFVNCTVPVGATPLLCVLTTAVRVTCVPAEAVEGLAERLVVVVAAVMVMAFVGEVLGL